MNTADARALVLRLLTVQESGDVDVARDPYDDLASLDRDDLLEVCTQSLIFGGMALEMYALARHGVALGDADDLAEGVLQGWVFERLQMVALGIAGHDEDESGEL